jgi:succinate-semialdehyde dehydrogenase / glutarate-semialdehyde dehydrogenase
MYPDVLLCINNIWTTAADGRTIPVVNPATEEVIGSVSHAGRADLDVALEAAAKEGGTEAIEPYLNTKFASLLSE